jgi:hypothetical protein
MASSPSNAMTDGGLQYSPNCDTYLTHRRTRQGAVSIPTAYPVDLHERSRYPTALLNYQQFKVRRTGNPAVAFLRRACGPLPSPPVFFGPRSSPVLLGLRSSPVLLGLLQSSTFSDPLRSSPVLLGLRPSPVLFGLLSLRSSPLDSSV